MLGTNSKCHLRVRRFIEPSHRVSEDTTVPALGRVVRLGQKQGDIARALLWTIC
jgi:hypothetical protein